MIILLIEFDSNYFVLDFCDISFRYIFSSLFYVCILKDKGKYKVRFDVLYFKQIKLGLWLLAESLINWWEKK